MADYYFYYGGVDHDWATTGNWWTDALHTTPAGGAPGALDDVITVGAAGAGPVVDLDTWTEPASIDATATGITFTSAAAAQLGIAITGDCTFNGDAASDDITGDATFNDDSRLGNALTGNGTFNDSSYNDGSIVGDATFNDDSHNDATITGDATFNDNSYNQSVISGDVTFNDSSYNKAGGSVGGDMTLNDLAQNRAGVTGDFTENRGYGINGSEILGMP